MHGLKLVALAIAVVSLLGPLTSVTARAESKGKVDTSLTRTRDSVNLTAEDEDTSPSTSPRASQFQSPDGPRQVGRSRGISVRDDPNTIPKAEYEKRRAAWEADVKRINAANTATLNAYGACLDSTQWNPCARPRLTDLPPGLTVRPEAQGGDANPVPATPPLGTFLPPEVVAYQAAVQMTVPAPKPGIGPPPEINEWDMAAVGYPLWLWAEGTTDPGPVSQTVFGLTVSLDARLTKVNFDMGDGNVVHCDDVIRRWHRGVKPGTESPVCGYRYQEPSLPKGEYTVTARSVWAVDWRVNGAGGTIPLYSSASTTLPVGELQVLER